MARITTTVYVCDSCRKEVERPRDLAHFRLEFYGRGGRTGYAGTAPAQLCDGCVEKLLKAAEGIGFDTAALRDEIGEPAAKTTGQP